MPTPKQYAALKAQGTCLRCRQRDRTAVPGFTRCAACLSYTPEEQAIWTQYRAHTVHTARPAPADGQFVACCDDWHLITQVPFTTQCCGRTYFEEWALAALLDAPRGDTP